MNTSYIAAHHFLWVLSCRWQLLSWNVVHVKCWNYVINVNIVKIWLKHFMWSHSKQSTTQWNWKAAFNPSQGNSWKRLRTREPTPNHSQCLWSRIEQQKWAAHWSEIFLNVEIISKYYLTLHNLSELYTCFSFWDMLILSTKSTMEIQYIASITLLFVFLLIVLFLGVSWNAREAHNYKTHFIQNLTSKLLYLSLSDNGQPAALLPSRRALSPQFATYVT